MSAQTLFARHDTTPNYQGYRYADECISAMNRLTADVDRKTRLWKEKGTDTVLYDPLRENRPRAAAAVAMGKQCLAGVFQVNVDTLQLSVGAGRVVEALLMADRDAEVERFFQRVWDGTTSYATKDSVADWAWSYYGDARPLRIDKMKEWYDRWLTHVPPDSVKARLRVASRLGGDWRVRVADSAFWRKVGWQAVQILDSIPITGRDRYLLVNMQKMDWLLERLTEDEQADSLARSTSAFWGVINRNKVRLYGEKERKTGYMSGVGIPQVTGDFIYRARIQPDSPAEPGLAPYTKVASSEAVLPPVSARVNLVVFLNNACHTQTRFLAWSAFGRGKGSADPCLGAVGSLRRLKERFPQLEITVVTRTFGSFGNSVRLQPAEEADTLAKYFLGFQRIPGTLAVSTTESFRIPGLDNRRIDTDTETELRFKEMFRDVFQGDPTETGRTYVVDEAGQFFGSGPLGTSDFYLAKLLAAVFRRGQQ